MGAITQFLEKVGYGPAYDATARGALKLSPTRLLLVSGMFAVLLTTLPLAQAAVWLGGMLALEMWLRMVLPGLVERPRLSLRLQRIVASVCISGGWVALGALLWSFQDGELRAASVALWAGNLLYAQSSCSKVPGHFALTGGPPLVAMAAAPFLTPGIPFGEMITLAGCSAVCVIHTVNSTAANLRAYRELKRAGAELIRQREAADAANQAKSNFLAMMSHELRTPMNGVLGLAHALERTGLDRKQTELLDGITRSGDALLGILNDILDLAKIEAGRMEVRPEAADLHHILAQARDLFSETAAAKGLELDLVIDASAPRWVSVDALRLRQILLNLVSNAVKFTPDGRVRVSARADGADGAGRAKVVIAVEDTGPGLAEEVAAKLFSPFYQGGAGIDRAYGGTGLGLAISRQLAAAMDGELTARNRSVGGSVFEIVLPLRAVAAPEDVEMAEAGDEEAEPLPALSILVAEDNAMNRAVVRALLEPNGWSLTFAENGALALDALRTHVFDLVLMDVHMPVMNGIAAVSAIRAGEAGDPSVPVIALTADAMSDDRTRLLAAGFDAHVSKPFRPRDLLAAISEVLAGEGDEADEAEAAGASASAA